MRALERSRPAAAHRPTAQPVGGRACRRARRGPGCAAPSRLAPAWCTDARSPGSTAFSSADNVEQLEELEDDADVRTSPDRELLFVHPVELPSVDGHRPGRRPVDPGDQVEDRRLAAARGPDDRDHLAGTDRGRRLVAPGSRAGRCDRPSPRLEDDHGLGTPCTGLWNRDGKLLHDELHHVVVATSHRGSRPATAEGIGPGHRPGTNGPTRLCGSSAAAIGQPAVATDSSR